MPDSNRRDFLKDCAIAAGSMLALNAQTPQQMIVRAAAEPSFKIKLAERELLRGLTALFPAAGVRMGTESAPGATAFSLRVEPAKHENPEGYTIAAGKQEVVLSGGSEAAVLYAVFDFLEKQGAFFGIDGPSYPLDVARSLNLPVANQPWTATPRFAVRGLLPWPDFLNCISVYNEEDFRAYFESMLRMRFNTFGMHVYTGANQWAESYLSFEYAGVGHLAFLDNSASHRWGYLPQRTSRYTMGASQFYDSEVFGSDSTRLARDPWETAERSRKLLKDAFRYANRLGITTGIGFEPYQIPDEVWRALPPEAKPKAMPDRNHPGPRFDIESVIARDLIETRLANLLETYPEAEHVWLWEDEQMNWESRKTGQPLSVTPFLVAHKFLRRHAPKKKLIIGGWGGVARHFADFHKRLPEDIVFSCLSDSLGWDPVHEVFGRLGSRERWPIPWIEDDPAMWLAQLHVHRFERDLNLAANYGCQGMIGIHWRHRIVDPVAAYQARFSWDPTLKPAAHYQAYARTQAAGERADQLASVLIDADKERKLLATGTGEVKDGHEVIQEYSGDYNEAFAFWNDYEPAPKVVDSQKQVAAAMRALADGANSALEKERLEYLTRHLEFMVAYTDAWIVAHRIHAVLKSAGDLKQAGQPGEARAKVLAEAVPLWLRLAPDVRRAMLHFQRIVATRNDLGTLASMHNKFVRLALVRLRLSMKEYLGELPQQVEALFAEVNRPDPDAPARLIVPTRPSLLGKGEKVRVMAIAAGNAPVKRVALHTRTRGAAAWTTTPCKLMGRRTYEVVLGPFDPAAALAEYYFTAEVGTQKLVAPAGGPNGSYTITLV